MKGCVIALDEVAGRKAAALIVDGRLQDIRIDPPENDPSPEIGEIYRAKVARAMGGQGGVMVTLPDGQSGFLRGVKGLEQGASVIVQVMGYAEGNKAAPVTTRLLFKSRYAIVTPAAAGFNIARSIRDEEDRDHLLELAHEAMEGAPEDFGVIIRSASAEAADEDIVEDVSAMRALAEAVVADMNGAPELLVAAPTSHEIAWRDWTSPMPDEVVESPAAFADLGVEEAVDALLSPRVELGGGAWAMFEPTAALLAIDVNTGGDLSLAAGLKANLALVRDLPRQLRLRGLSGQITMDLAPMPKKDRRLFEDKLRSALRSDATDTVLAGWTPLGHFELQRKRDRAPLHEIWPS